MTLEIIQAKRAALLAECERAKGAIQALDDLISEVTADRERRMQIAAFEKVRARVEAAIPPAPWTEQLDWRTPAPDYCTPDGLANCEAWAVGSRCGTCPASVPTASDSPPMSPPSPPEMFGREVPGCGSNCVDADACDKFGCARDITQ